MTQNQIRFQEHKETQRANLAREAETYRNNVAVLSETNRHNVVTETETGRHNRATEAEQRRGNDITATHYQNVDRMTQQQNEYMRQYYNQSLAEQSRSNRAQEQLRAQDQVIAGYNAQTNRQNAVTNQRNVEVSAMNARTNAYNAQTNRMSASNQMSVANALLPYQKLSYTTQSAQNKSSADLNKQNTKNAATNQYTGWAQIGTNLLHAIGSFF